MAVAETVSSPASSDPTLQPFLQPDFDPVAYLNSTLPTLSTSTSAARQQQAHNANLVLLSNETQVLLSRLGAQATRLSNTLTQLTDEIIRSGGRLAYEVELLRGEAIGLSDAFESGLKDDLKVFLPASPAQEDGVSVNIELGKDFDQNTGEAVSNEHGYMERLHVLSTVRQRLDAVIKTFDEAMKWPIAPSEVNATASSIISIAAPTDPQDVRDQELKAQEFSKQIATDLEALSLDDTKDGENLAAQRVNQLRDIASVWSGTAEEKARAKQLETLQKLVEDKQTGLAKSTTSPHSGVQRPIDYRYGNIDGRSYTENSYNFLQNLRATKG